MCCPQCKETNADTFKATEANRRREPRNREKASSRRINLEDNTHA
jgi:phage FluMu protein Com